MISLVWTEAEDSAISPSACIGASLCAVDDNRALVFGGGSPNGMMADAWIWNVKKKEWKPVGSTDSNENRPSPRYQHACVSNGNKGASYIPVCRCFTLGAN